MQGYTNASAAATIRLVNQSATFSTQSTPDYAAYPCRAAIAITGCTTLKQATVTYNPAEATSGKYAPFCETYNGGVYLYSKVTGTITVAAIVLEGVSNFYNMEATPTQNSGNPITSGGVYTNCVRTTGNQEIGGIKTFTGGISNSNCLLVNPGTDTNYREGIRIAKATDGWGLMMLGTTLGSTSGMSGWIIGNDPNGTFMVSGKDATTATGLFYGTYNPSTATHFLNVPHNFRVGGQQVIQLCNDAYNNTPGLWGMLTPANGYTGVLSIWRNSGVIEIAEKGTSFYLQVDGHMYQRNNYRVLDEGDEDNTTTIGSLMNLTNWTPSTNVVTRNTVAHWNGAYQSNPYMSNLAYCVHGAFGNIVTHNLTISTGGPSGGSNGDVWIQY